MKKFTAKIIAIVISTFFLSFSTLAPTMAAGSSEVKDCRYFLGMVSWDCGTNLTDGETPDSKGITEGVWIIVLNILSDISVIAAYLTLGYVVYGGYQYIFSSGDPAKVVTSKKVLAQAFTGIAIVMLASIILNTIRIVLGVNFSNDCTTSACPSPESASTMFDSFINWVIAIGGIISAIFVVYGGIAYMTSSGEPNKIQKAKNIITYALIGLAIVGLAKVITTFVFNAINQASAGSYINTTIVKELNEK